MILLAVVFFGVIGFLGARKERAARGAGSDTTQVSEADTKGTTLYTSAEESLNDELRPHWLPFSFRYPDDWVVTERGDSAGGQNFVKVEKGENGFTAENFAVGYMSAPPGHESDPELVQQLLSQFEQQFSAQFAGFQRVGEDRMELGGRQATGFRFTSTVQTEGRGAVQVFGRVLVVPVGGGKGLSIIMLGTPIGSGLQSVDDLGVKGGIPVILRTFRIGDSATAGSDSATAGSDSAGAGDDAASTGMPGKPLGKPGTEPGEPDEGPGLREIRPIDDDSAL
jgi:hypothetical protein